MSGHDHFLLHAGKKRAHIRESVCFAAIDFAVRERFEKTAWDMVQVRVGVEFAELLKTGGLKSCPSTHCYKG